MTIKNIELSDVDPNISLGEALTGENIDLIKNVKVKMKVFVGETELSIEDLFELKEGSIIAINRAISEPVDLVLNGKVVARGEIVAADDNFGLRIVDISK